MRSLSLHQILFPCLWVCSCCPFANSLLIVFRKENWRMLRWVSCVIFRCVSVPWYKTLATSVLQCLLHYSHYSTLSSKLGHLWRYLIMVCPYQIFTFAFWSVLLLPILCSWWWSPRSFERFFQVFGTRFTRFPVELGLLAFHRCYIGRALLDTSGAFDILSDNCWSALGDVPFFA